MVFLDNGKSRDELKEELQEYLTPHHEGIVDWYVHPPTDPRITTHTFRIWVTMSAMSARNATQAVMPQQGALTFSPPLPTNTILILP